MKSSAELGISLSIVSQIIIMCVWESLTLNCVVAEEHVTIVHRGFQTRPQLVPDKFVLHKSNCAHSLPTHCTAQINPVTAATQTCQCVCSIQTPTIGYIDNEWSCTKDDVFQNFSDQRCNLSFADDASDGMLLVRAKSWRYINLWKQIYGSHCSIDWSISGVLECNNTISPVQTRKGLVVYLSGGKYILQVADTIDNEIKGRIMKIGVYCNAKSQTTHCLMVKVEGELRCPMIPIPTTSIPTTSFVPTTHKDYTTLKVSTVTPSTRVSGEVEKKEGDDSSVPVLPIAGGVAAALIFVIILAVFLLCRQKHQRKTGRSTMHVQDAQQRQATHRLSEDVYYSNIKSPSPDVEGVHGAPVYEMVPDQERKLDAPSDNDVEVISRPASTNQEYDCIWNVAENNESLLKESTKQLGSEHYDYARPEGTHDKDDSQSAWYDVPECEVGTVRPLPGQNYYEVAGTVIPGEEVGVASDQEHQDAIDDVTVNLLYSYASVARTGDTPS